VEKPDGIGSSAWQFTGSYWLARERGDWSGCPDVYSAAP
jgi:hypothetical protein